MGLPEQFYEEGQKLHEQPLTGYVFFGPPMGIERNDARPADFDKSAKHPGAIGSSEDTPSVDVESDGSAF